MGTPIKFLMIIGVVAVVMYLLPTVSVLPFGSEEIIQNMSSYIYQFRLINPFFDSGVTYLFFFFYIEFLLFTWHWTKWVIEHLR